MELAAKGEENGFLRGAEVLLRFDASRRAVVVNDFERVTAIVFVRMDLKSTGDVPGTVEQGESPFDDRRELKERGKLSDNASFKEEVRRLRSDRYLCNDRMFTEFGARVFMK